jgi:hypothetical protein
MIARTWREFNELVMGGGNGVAAQRSGENLAAGVLQCFRHYFVLL